MSESAKTSTAVLADLTDDQILSMIERGATDPFVAKELLHLQKQAFDHMSKATQKVLDGLTALEPASAKAWNTPTSVVALASAAREREATGKQKREVAESLVIGAMMNRDNPDWDLLDENATIPASAARNGVLALIKMPMPASLLEE
ncbi:MAG TPA: hypothetical protein VM571_15010 [Noviherbaspirillum sp.]|nr:hypothetical protein [Noviherbaspirillum sp.]